MQHVFVYGTLLFPEIIEGLTGKSFAAKVARLEGYERRSLRGADFPALIKNAASSVTGKILLNVDDRSFDILRFFEGDDYQWIEVEVEVETANEKLCVCVFIWIGRAERLEEKDWDRDFFKRNILQGYLKYIIPETVADFTKLFS